MMRLFVVLVHQSAMVSSDHLIPCIWSYCTCTEFRGRSCQAKMSVDGRFFFPSMRLTLDLSYTTSFMVLGVPRWLSFKEQGCRQPTAKRFHLHYVEDGGTSTKSQPALLGIPPLKLQSAASGGELLTVSIDRGTEIYKNIL